MAAVNFQDGTRRQIPDDVLLDELGIKWTEGGDEGGTEYVIPWTAVKWLEQPNRGRSTGAGTDVATRKAHGANTVTRKARKAAPIVTVEAADELPAILPDAARKAGVIRITGQTDAKRRLNWAIVKAVVVDGIDPADISVPSMRGDKPMDVRQVRRIVELAKGAPSKYELESAVAYDPKTGRREVQAP